MNKVASYTTGLILATVLTLTAFGLVFAQTHSLYGALTHSVLLGAILTLAMIQLVVQLIFFLHLGRQKSSQWNMAVFCFTFFGILVIVLASVWIMYHLNYNMMPAQINQYINDQSSF